MTRVEQEIEAIRQELAQDDCPEDHADYVLHRLGPIALEFEHELDYERKRIRGLVQTLVDLNKSYSELVRMLFQLTQSTHIPDWVAEELQDIIDTHAAPSTRTNNDV